MQGKKELRRAFSERRRVAKSDIRDIRLTDRLLSCEQVINADTVLIFASFGSEPDTWNIAERLLCKGKRLAFPRCGENGEMTFHTVRELSQLRDGTNGRYGICEPDASLPCPELTDKTVCIAPGLAFTENGHRLGYGGGYYDRFIGKHPEIYTIGLAYEAVITDTLPVSEHDMTVNSIVTEERTVLCNAR